MANTIMALITSELLSVAGGKIIVQELKVNISQDCFFSSLFLLTCSGRSVQSLMLWQQRCEGQKKRIYNWAIFFFFPFFHWSWITARLRSKLTTRTKIKWILQEFVLKRKNWEKKISRIRRHGNEWMCVINERPPVSYILTMRLLLANRVAWQWSWSTLK